MNRWGLPCLLLTFSLVLTPVIALATEKPGGTCPSPGKRIEIAGGKYHCAKSGKHLVWAKSIKNGKVPPTATSNSLKRRQVIVLPKSRSFEITSGPAVGFISADSKLPVGMSSSTPLICTVNDQLVTLLRTGSCSISVTQAGNDQYLAADQVNFSFDVIPPVITTHNSLLEGVQSFVDVPKGTTYSSETAEFTLTNFINDATAKVCANDPTAPGCLLANGAGVADPSSQTKYVEFVFHVKNLDANPLPPISYRLLLKGQIMDIDTGVTLQTLNNIDINSGESTDGSFFGVVPINLKLDSGYLLIDEGVTDSSVKLLMKLGN